MVTLGPCHIQVTTDAQQNASRNKGPQDQGVCWVSCAPPRLGVPLLWGADQEHLRASRRRRVWVQLVSAQPCLSRRPGPPPAAQGGHGVLTGRGLAHSACHVPLRLCRGIWLPFQGPEPLPTVTPDPKSRLSPPGLVWSTGVAISFGRWGGVSLSLLSSPEPGRDHGVPPALHWSSGFPSRCSRPAARAQGRARLAEGQRFVPGHIQASPASGSRPCSPTRRLPGL